MRWKGLTRIIVLAVGMTPVIAASNERSEIEELRTLVEAQAAQLELLRARIDELERSKAAQDPVVTGEARTAAGESSAGGAAPAENDQGSIQWKGAPELASPDGTFTAKLRGRVMADVWATSARTAGIDYPEGTTLRAGRLGVQGQLGGAFRYKFEGDYAGDDVTVKDAYLQYVGRPGWSITLGNQKPPFSLEHVTSLPRTVFMERALPNVFAFSESLGISAATAGDYWSFALGLFGETPGVELDGEESYGITGRLAFAPVHAEERFVHLGLSGYRRHMTSDSGADFRVRQRPEVRVFGTRLVDTGAIAAGSSTAVALELAGGHGPFALQGEYLRNRVEYRLQDDATFDGAYLQASWFLTGEHRPYDVGKASFGRVKPHGPLDAGGWGAFEVAARLSTLDLNDGVVQGGEEDNITVGLNWYPTAYTRFAFNWVYFDVDDSFATLPFGSPSHEGHAFGARAQVDW